MPTAKVIILKRTTSTTGRQTEPLLRKENHFGSTMLQSAKPTLQTGTDTTHPEPSLQTTPSQAWRHRADMARRTDGLQKVAFQAAKGHVLRCKRCPFAT